MKSTRLLLSMGTLLAGLIFSAGGAKADDWKPVGQFGWFGVGKVQEIEKGHIYWVGEFSGIFLSDQGDEGLLNRAGMKCPGWNDLDLNKKKNTAGGYCVVSDPGGDQAFLTWKLAGNTQRGSGTFEWTGGTGKYKEINGSNTFVGVTQVNWPDGTASGYSTFNR